MKKSSKGQKVKVGDYVRWESHDGRQNFVQVIRLKGGLVDVKPITPWCEECYMLTTGENFTIIEKDSLKFEMMIAKLQGTLATGKELR